MAVKPENTFISGVHKHLCSTVYRMKTNNPYVAGIPDCYYSGSKGELWVEYKFIVIPKRATTMIEVNLSALQLAWLRGRHDEGRKVAVIVGSSEGGIVLDAYETHPLTPEDFRSRIKSRAELALWVATQTKR